jgi:Family of unknown function (DUF6328)
MTEKGIPDREETDAERHDRQLGELLQEVRVAVPGVQVLFAFLLTVPFASAWDKTTDLQQDVYFATLLMTAIATAFLMAPGSIHRVLFKQSDKQFIVNMANWLLLAGLGALAVAIGLAVFLVADVLFDITAAAIAAGCIFGFTVGLWYVLPLVRRLRHEVAARR